jgi:hypothetical protein
MRVKTLFVVHPVNCLICLQGRYVSRRFWKPANVTAVFKKSDKSITSYYRPISLFSCVSIIFERTVFKYVLISRHKYIHKLQSGFIWSRCFLRVQARDNQISVMSCSGLKYSVAKNSNVNYFH